jgi:NTP pyrophosphatase (non-canonical NTP hydrolase)
MSFIKDAIRTESHNFHVENVGHRLIHASMGLVTEAAEFQDALKKSLFYGKPLDKTNLKEEIGDILWYLAIAMDELETDFDVEQDRVIRKLKARYPSKFENELAENRDLATERKILETEVK